ncbi:ethanolamine kinase [Zootermopsis nevadensis]|uniref:ethanolamine kinase n=1 Tax=Zootermopsis nevadensis TaxID=136037 RepID=A0A067QIM2_ZOONE|nr:ethanolamine kinase [Zootermopsis nevadensis]KDR07130.1 Ethanolamine kinase [Zootermopsis nevadensis]
MNQSPVHIPLTISEDKLIDGSVTVLSIIRPTWAKEKVNFKVFTDGITNKLLGCFHEEYPEDVVLVRVYGHKTDLLIDRNAETRNIQLLHNAGYAPRLYATFCNGLAYEYVPGVILNTTSCRDADVFPLVARMMALMHKVSNGDAVSKEPSVWLKIQQFLDIMPHRFQDPEKQARFVDLIPPKSKLEAEYAKLKAELSSVGSPIVFCHNDLLLANIIYHTKKNTVTFIDYEYSNYNYQAFDIGNHFAEFAGVTDVDYAAYPSQEFQRQWLRVYLETFHGSTTDTSLGEDASDAVTEHSISCLYVQVNKFSLASHFLWAIWALIQAEHSTIDFDFLGYADIRLKEYFAKKDRFLSLTVESL